MQRLFSTFPAGRPGFGLLLLRLVVGLTLIIQGTAYFNNLHSLRFETSAALALILTAGICFLFGILTPVTSVLVVLFSIGCAFSWIPTPAASLFESKLVLMNVIAISTAILFLGPGAFSLDARLFGRREIFIPTTQRPMKS